MAQLFLPTLETAINEQNIDLVWTILVFSKDMPTFQRCLAITFFNNQKLPFGLSDYFTVKNALHYSSRARADRQTENGTQR